MPDEVIQLFITFILKSIFYSDFELLNGGLPRPDGLAMTNYKSPTQTALKLEVVRMLWPRYELELRKYRRYALVALNSRPDHKTYQEEPMPEKLSGSLLKSAVPSHRFVESLQFDSP